MPLLPDTSMESVSEARPAQNAPNTRIVTQTRKIVNSSVAIDYRDVCRQLDTAVGKVQDLIQAKNDLELMASLCNISLEAPADAP